MINLTLLRKIHSKIRLMNMCYDGALLNEEGGISLNDASYALTFVISYKMYVQSKNVINKLSDLHKTLIDFSNGNMDKYIDDHNTWFKDEDVPFDPYQHLEEIFKSFSAFDLPKNIIQYKELYEFSQRFTDLDKKLFLGLEEVLGKLEVSVFVKDEDGNTRLVPESELSEEQRESRKISSELSGIEADHAYDYYDKWYETMSRMIEERAEFIDMLNLIKI